MPTLVIHAPYSQVQQNDRKSFDQTVSTGIGEGYAINRSLFQELSPGDPVVVICKVHQKQARGRIKQLRPTEKAGNGIQRYDVVMEDLQTESFTHGTTRLNRNGVAVV
jgi:hypothetical protein